MSVLWGRDRYIYPPQITIPLGIHTPSWISNPLDIYPLVYLLSRRDLVPEIPPPSPWTDRRHLWKHCLPTTTVAVGNYANSHKIRLRITRLWPLPSGPHPDTCDDFLTCPNWEDKPDKPSENTSTVSEFRHLWNKIAKKKQNKKKNKKTQGDISNINFNLDTRM